MKSIKQLERLRRIHKLIRAGNTGTPDELANKLGVSKRQIHNIVEDLKIINAPVDYNRKIKSYYYKKAFKLRVRINVEVLLNDELINIYGGRNFLRKIIYCKGSALNELKFELSKHLSA